MQISPFHVQVFLLVFHKEPGRNCIDNHTDPCSPDNGSTFHRNRMEQFINTFSNNNTYSNQ